MSFILTNISSEFREITIRHFGFSSVSWVVETWKCTIQLRTDGDSWKGNFECRHEEKNGRDENILRDHKTSHLGSLKNKSLAPL